MSIENRGGNDIELLRARISEAQAPRPEPMPLLAAWGIAVSEWGIKLVEDAKARRAAKTAKAVAKARKVF